MLSNVEKALYEYLILSPQNATYMTKKEIMYYVKPN